MKVIGIVGGIGAGKSTVAALFGKLTSLHTISADLIGHEILLKEGSAYQKVISQFGTDFLDENKEIIRKKLGEKVFASPEALKQLNAITHPLIEAEIKRRIACYEAATPDGLVILEAALLIESGLDALTDAVVGVYADEQLRVERVKLRDALTAEAVWKRITAQKKWEELEKVSDYIIDNSLSLEATEKQVKEVLAQIKQKVKGGKK